MKGRALKKRKVKANLPIRIKDLAEREKILNRKKGERSGVKSTQKKKGRGREIHGDIELCQEG